MKNQKMIDEAFKEFEDTNEWYLISNLIYDVSDKKEKQYLFDKAEQVYDKYLLADDFIDMLRWAITEKLEVNTKILDKLEALISRLVKEKSELVNFYTLLKFAGIYRKETYPNKNGASFNDPKKVKNWVSESVNLAETADNFSDIIAHVAEEYGGLHLGDKNWGKELLVIAKSKLDSKSFKKTEKTTAPLLS